MFALRRDVGIKSHFVNYVVIGDDIISDRMGGERPVRQRRFLNAVF